MDNTKRFVDMGGVIGLGNDFIEEEEIWSPVGMSIIEIEVLFPYLLSSVTFVMKDGIVVKNQ